MNKVNFSAWDNDVTQNVNEIYRVAAQIKSVQKKLPTNDITYTDDNFKVFYDNIRRTLNFWTGRTYVGKRKNKSVQKAFQVFFMALYDFLLFCRREDNSILHLLKDLADATLYRGTLYRYLGHSTSDSVINEKVEPEYNKIYVSWSKTPNNSVTGKLCGTKTLLVCDVAEPHYGIDLEIFGVVRSNETEVVFPTIKETITDIKYIE